jgi:anti-sigma B factor antagonist
MRLDTMPRTTDFSVDIEADAGGTVIRLHGEVDVRTAPQLRTSLLEALASGAPRVEADFSDVSFIDACGLGVLASAVRRARHEGTELLVRNPTHSVVRLLEITGLSRVLPVVY